MSRFLNRILCREKLKFILTKDDKDQIINSLHKILKTEGFTINLSGKVINDNEFQLTDKVTFGIYIQGGGNPAELNGKFTKNSKDNFLTIKAKSHPLFPVATIFIPVLVIPLMLTSDLNSSGEKILSVIFGIFITVIINLGGNFYKQRLLNKTINELGLKDKL